MPYFVQKIPEAKDALKDYEPPIMIVESNLPGIKEFIAYVSENHKKVKTIFTTTYTRELEEYKCLYKTFLVPYKIDLMLAAIHEAFNSENQEAVAQELDVN